MTMTSEQTREEPPVLYEIVEHTACLTLNRPAVVNAINTGLRNGIATSIDKANSDPQVHAILIRGAGPRGFCAGADISEFTPPSDLLEARDAKHAMQWIDRLASSTKPTIAAIHGYCLGGGLELALACDFRIAAEDAAFASPEVTLGIIPGAGGTQRLPRIVGIGHALSLILTGSRIDASRALAIGLVGEVVPLDELNAAGLALAERFASLAPRAVSAAKEAIRRGFDMPLDDGIRLEADLSTLLYSTEDRAEGAAAFREHRRPQFRGR